MNDVGRSFRPIAPRNGPSPGGGPGGRQLPSSGGGGPPEEGRIKRASTACKECQQRRTRCSGDPCTECQTHQRTCIFDELSDKRRKASAKRTQEELSNLREFVDQLLWLLREGDNTIVERLISTIRTRVSQDQIRHLVLHLASQNLSPHSHPQHRNDFDPNTMSSHMGQYYNRQ